MDVKKLLPSRIPILYLMLAVLTAVAVIPVIFTRTKLVDINRERLITQERLLQNTITRSLADDIQQRQTSLNANMANLASAIQVTSGNNLAGEHVATPELRALLENFVKQSDGAIAYATVVNNEMRGMNAGRIVLDEFLQRELEHAFQAARENRSYNGPAFTLGSGKQTLPIRLVGIPLMVNGNFVGMIASVVDMSFLSQRLERESQGGLDAYVVDNSGRLVATANHDYVVGQNMSRIELVKNFLDTGGKSQVVATSEFTIQEDGREVKMLGTYSPVSGLGWAVIAQKSQADAYRSIIEMQRAATWLALGAVILSLVISMFAARKITTPLETLTESSRAIAKGDFSKRVQLRSRTEIGELAETFNHMTEDLERFVFDLKRAAEENKQLFLSSIQMLAGAVDEKDPYTKGHSDRVTRYSVIIAKELGLTSEEIEKIRISAQLHDVGKIGIEDRILKKPGALTPDEYEVMKQHTSKGASILRPVEMLKEMIPGIELHHESLDGRGYPHGLKGDQVPLMPRIITVADTFDAMTTNRPYQAAMDPEYVVRIINSLATTKFDPRVVAAVTAVFERGGLRIHRAGVVQQAAAAAAGADSDAAAPSTSTL